MIVPYSEIILRRHSYSTINDIWIINHPVDLREPFKYKRMTDSFFRTASRSDYDYIKERSIELIHYED